MSRLSLPFEYDGPTKTAKFLLYVPGGGGNARRKKTLHDVTVDEALTAWLAFKTEVAEKAVDGTIRSRPPLTLRQFVDQYWDRIAAGWARTTLQGNLYALRRRLLPALGDLRLDRIRDCDVQDFVNAMKKDGFKPSYVNNCLRLLRSLVGQAIARGELREIPFRRRPVLREQRLRLELSEEERLAVLAAFDDRTGFMSLVERERQLGPVKTGAGYPRERRFGGGLKPDSDAAVRYFERFRTSRSWFVVALETGVRKGDLLRLRWDAVDLAQGWVRFHQQKTNMEVTIPLSTAAREVLQDLARRRVNGVPFVFAAKDRRLAEMAVRRYWSIVKEIAGIKRRVRLHDLRHTFASRLASAGVSLQVIASVLGHTSVRMAERYARPNEAALRSICKALDDGPP